MIINNSDAIRTLRGWWIGLAGLVLFVLSCSFATQLGGSLESSQEIFTTIVISLGAISGLLMIWAQYAVKRDPESFRVFRVQGSSLVFVVNLLLLLSLSVGCLAILSLLLFDDRTIEMTAFYVALGAALATMTCLLMSLSTRHYVRKSRVKKGCCAVCNYDLSGLEKEMRCPECGAENS